MSCNFIFCKTGVALIKKVTIPRLELMGAFIGVEMIQFVKEAIQIDISRSVLLTDAKCVLFWIGSKKKLPTFIENRLHVIKSHNDLEFRYVPTADNPADLPTRGINAHELVDLNLWWNGPSYLLLNEENWPEMWNYEIEEESNIEETMIDNIAKKITCMEINSSVMVIKQSPFGINAEKYSSLYKVLRITARCI